MKSKKKLLVVGAAVLLIGGVGTAVLAQSSARQSAPSSITLRALDGSNVSISTLKKPAILAVGASWLPLSREQVKVVNALQQSFANRGVAVYFISTDSGDAKSNNYATDAQLTSFGERNKLGVTTLRDPNGATLKAFNLDQIPSFVILDKEGKVTATISGFDPESDLTKQISTELDKIL